MVKAVIFDMDGVLIEAKDWHYESLNKALSFFGQEISRYDHLITFDGLPTKKKLAMLSDIGDLPYDLHNLINDLKSELISYFGNIDNEELTDYIMTKLKHIDLEIPLKNGNIKRNNSRDKDY